MREVRAWLLFVVAVLALAALSAAGCGSNPAPSPTSLATTASATSSGIDGLMTIEGPLSGDPHPKPGARIDVHQGGETGEVVATTRSGADGAFSVDVPPGRYTVKPVPAGNEGVLRASAAVNPGERAWVQVGFSVR